MDERINKIALHKGLLKHISSMQDSIRELFEVNYGFLGGEKKTLNEVMERCVEVEIMIKALKALIGCEKTFNYMENRKLNEMMEEIKQD